ncbi:MAG: hypothetical protein IH991_19860 [Planctomycetes bacterium]|nr:hypothetical protein [Planctomycetota bacterium]
MPTAVADFAARDIGDLSLTLNWKAASDDNGVAGYEIHRGLKDNFACNEKNRVGRVEEIVTWSDSAPPAGETVWYAVQTVDVAGRLSSPQYVKVDVPANRRPENQLKLSALAAGERAFLHWSGSLEPDVVAIEIMRGEGKDGELKTVKSITDLTTKRFVDEGLKADSVFRYAIRLVDRGKLTSELGKVQLVRAGLFIKRINCGGDEVIGADGIPWEADKQRVAGTAVWTAKSEIADAGDIMAVYQTERWSYNGLRYRFDVKPGRYEVVLHFAETNRQLSAAGKRMFDVLINGRKHHSAVDIAAKVGANRAWQLSTPIIVSDKELVVELRKVKAGPALKGIEVRAQPDADSE